MDRSRVSTRDRAAIIEQHAAGYTFAELGKAYGRDPRTISRIVKRAEVDPDKIRAAPPLPTRFPKRSTNGQQQKAVQQPGVHRAYRQPFHLVLRGSSTAVCGAEKIGRPGHDYAETREDMAAMSRMGFRSCSPCWEKSAPVQLRGGFT